MVCGRQKRITWTDQHTRSRMLVEMPYAANFGVEDARLQDEGAIPINKPEEGLRSDRELARIIAGLFEVLCM